MHIDAWESKQLYCSHTNPSPVLLANGTVVMAFNGGFCNNGLMAVGIAVADNLKGPYRLLTHEPVLRDEHGKPYEAEEPHLWHTARGWHMLFHHPPTMTSEYAYSEDGLNWKVNGGAAVGCSMSFSDGSQKSTEGCAARQQIIFDDGNSISGCSPCAADHPNSTPRPAWLISAAKSSKPGGGTGSWTMIRKLKSVN